MTIRLEAARIAGCALGGGDLSTVRVGKAARWSYWSGEHLDGLLAHEVFVFASNRSGWHARGAGVEAIRCYGARRGVSEGLVERSYALPTQGGLGVLLSLAQIGVHVGRFLAFASRRSDLRFFLHGLGDAESAYGLKGVALLFDEASANVVLPSRFVDVLVEPLDGLQGLSDR